MRRNLFLKAYLLSLVILAGGLTEVAWSEHGSNSAETITASWFDNVTDLVPSIDDYDGSHSNLQGCNCAGQWRWQLLPDGLIYHSYLAGVKEPRFAGNWMNEDNLGDLWDVSLGGRFPLVRYGSCSLGYPQGWQVDMEGGVMPRLSRDDDLDLISADYRFGIPVTYGCGNTQYKLAYYHLSSHMGDEYLEANPGAQRINYSRDALVLGISHYLRPSFRVYGETGFGMETDGGSQPWEFQFGAEFAQLVQLASAAHRSSRPTRISAKRLTMAAKASFRRVGRGEVAAPATCSEPVCSITTARVRSTSSSTRASNKSASPCGTTIKLPMG